MSVTKIRTHKVYDPEKIMVGDVIEYYRTALSLFKDRRSKVLGIVTYVTETVIQVAERISLPKKSTLSSDQIGLLTWRMPIL